MARFCHADTRHSPLPKLGYNDIANHVASERVLRMHNHHSLGCSFIILAV